MKYIKYLLCLFFSLSYFLGNSQDCKQIYPEFNYSDLILVEGSQVDKNKFVTYTNKGNLILGEIYGSDLETSDNYRLCVYDIVGKQVYQSNINGEEGENIHEFSVGIINKGLYFISLQKNKDIYAMKVTVQ